MKIQKPEFVYLLFLFAFLFLSTSNKQIDFCKRVKLDQSNLHDGENLKRENNKNLKKRKRIFKKNLSILKSVLTNNNSAPINDSKCFSEFVLCTLIHNSQHFPESIFDTSTINLLFKNQREGTINKDHLRMALTFYKSYTDDNKRCKKMKTSIDYAIQKWNINEGIESSQFDKIENIIYIDCN